MDESEQQAEISGKGSKLPVPGHEVMVRCPGFRCLAYRDKDGKWRGVAHDEEMPEVLEVLWQP